MRLRTFANLQFLFVLSAAAHAAPPIELELATEQGLQITAPQEWLQLATSLGIDNVRIRTANPSDQPQLTNRGTGDRPNYYVVGILTAREELRLPGSTFHITDRKKLQDYFQHLAAEGRDAIAAHGRFGLTESQLAAVRADLAQSIEFPTKGQSLRVVVDLLQAKFSLRLSTDATASRALRNEIPIPDEVRGITAGTGLAILLRGYGLGLMPEKPLGQPIVLRIAASDANADSWPVGWEPEKSPRELAPALLEFLNVEIDNYTVQEALDAIQPRVKIPFFVDHQTLIKNDIKLDQLPAKITRTRTFYKRVLDRVLAPAHLAGQLHVDEAGTAFLWITK